MRGRGLQSLGGPLPPFVIHSLSPGHLHVSFPSKDCNIFPLLTNQTRTLSQHCSWPPTPGQRFCILALSPPLLPGEAVVSATCLAAGYPSLPFFKSLMLTPTFCHSFLLTPRNRPELLPFLFPKHTYFTRRHTHNQAQSSTTALPRFSYFCPITVSSFSYRVS